ncbi:MAG: alpha/beta hydrolase [Nitriliruptorales bacterium]|nr:alpha/beta hydrolase [Nitriliruptorales bacterium]
MAPAAAAFREAEAALWRWAEGSPRELELTLRDGASVRAVEIGEGPAVVFIHGTTNSGASWAALASRLATDLRCIVLDRPGCGLSPALTTAVGVGGLRDHADHFVADVLDALGEEQGHVVSTSFGGLLALRGAAAHPERIRRILHFGWTMGARVEKLPMVMRMAKLPGMARLMAVMPVNERAVRSMFRQIGLKQALEAGRVPQQVVECYVALLRHTDTMKNELAMAGGTSLPGLIDALALEDELLARVTATTRFVWGEEDPFGGPEAAAEFASRLPNGELQLVPGAGHAVWLDDLDLAVDAARAHLSTNEGPG